MKREAIILMTTILSSTAAMATEPSRPLITGVSHIAVYAANLAASERFYVHDLGGFKADDAESGEGVRY